MTTKSPLSPLCILLVEDSLPDIELAFEVLEETEFNADVKIAKDGIEALSYLEQNKNNLPDLIFLDLNIPRLNGLELLKKIKENEHLKKIPVIMLSTSDARHDIEQSYKNGCNCFITKPSSFNDYVHVMRNIKAFWGTTVQRPGAFS